MVVGNRKRKSRGNDDNEECSEDDSDEDDIEDVNTDSVTYRKRDRRVIRYRSYETDDFVNYKQEKYLIVTHLWMPKRLR